MATSRLSRREVGVYIDLEVPHRGHRVYGGGSVSRAERQGRRVRARALGCALGAVLIAVSGCETAPQKQAAHNAEVNHQASKEIERICALHGEERAAELKKIKDQSGLELYCPED